MSTLSIGGIKFPSRVAPSADSADSVTQNIHIYKVENQDMAYSSQRGGR